MAIKVRQVRIRTVTVPMENLLAQKLASVQDMIRRELTAARRDNREANVSGLSATARGLKTKIEEERARG